MKQSLLQYRPPVCETGPGISVCMFCTSVDGQNESFVTSDQEFDW